MACENPKCQCEHCEPTDYISCGCGEHETCGVCGGWENERNEDKMNQNMGQSANAGFTRDDSKTATRLLDKNWSPLIVRKYQMEGWPLFISLICDANLNDLDEVVYGIHAEAKEHGFTDGNIQDARNYCGFMSDRIKEHYNNVKNGVVEGIAVIWYVDKCFISSCYGDLMTHTKCAIELYGILNMLPHI